MKNVFIILAAFCLLTTQPASAQYHTYTSGQPNIEVDMSVLDALPAPARGKNYNSVTPPAAPRAPVVTQAPIDVRPDPFGDIISREAERPAPAPMSPAPKRLLKPVLTARPAAPRVPLAPAKPASMPVPVKKPNLPEPEYVPQIIEEPAPEETLTPAEETAALPATEGKMPLEAEPAAAIPAVPSLSDLTLSFTGNVSELDEGLRHKLDAVALQMQEAVEGRLQVRAYATGEDGTASSARRIALSRALAIRSYLMDQGIKPARVDVRALGSETDRSPIDRADLVFTR